MKWLVSLVIVYGHLYLPRGFCVGMNGLTCSFYHPKGGKDVTDKGNRRDTFRVSIHDMKHGFWTH